MAHIKRIRCIIILGLVPLFCLICGVVSCNSYAEENVKSESKQIKNPEAFRALLKKDSDPKTILARPQVPVLCYHQIRDWLVKDSKTNKDYIAPIQVFKSHMKMLADNGYHTILPDQLYDYLNNGASLPSKPIMLTFDDTDLDQFEIAAPTLEQYGFKGVFFIMTVSLGRKHYMSTEQVKELSDRGHVIGAHTWDHHDVRKYKEEDWVVQVEKPRKLLKKITGKDVDYFAYPFGLWNHQAVVELKKQGFQAAFQLASKRDQEDPLFTIRRIIASGYYSAQTLQTTILKSF